MSRITKYSFFVTVFGVSLIWFGITLMILMFHEDNVSRRIIMESLEYQKRLELEDHFKNANQRIEQHNPAVAQNHSQQDRRANLDSKQLRIKGHKEQIKRIKHNFDKVEGDDPVRQEEVIVPPKIDSEMKVKDNVVEMNPPVPDANKLEMEPKKDIEVENYYAPPGSEWERLKHLDNVAPENAPGEMGNPVKINRTALSHEKREQYDKLFKRNAFNQYASDMISYHRRLVDIRTPECQAKTYPSDLPNTSVIICLHNEAWSVLLRTVHSVLNRSPPHLIHEIILVDDFSDMEHLKKPLDNYMARLKKVKVLHTKKREGLVRARLLGYAVSTGDTLTFLDSHVECFPGWLEPLLDRVKSDPTVLVSPLIPFIDEKTFASQKTVAALVAVGGFDIDKLAFNWNNIPRDKRQNVFTANPMKSPTIAGGLFTISREFFTKIGTYDEGMNIWGGENLEISFRVWMCGGSLEIHPCSAVAHVFRSESPYKWGESFFEVLRHNAVRVAEVWMDDYKYYYYETLNFNLGNYGDVSARKALREKLKCHSFDWYVKNVYPDIKMPKKAVYTGELKSKLVNAICVDSMGKMTEVLGQPCHGLAGNQFFRFTVDGEIGKKDLCLDYISDKEKIFLRHCNKATSQIWEYTEAEQIKLKFWDLCLELTSDRRTLALRQCRQVLQQQWTWTRKMM